MGAPPRDGASKVFDEARTICERDEGALWDGAVMTLPLRHSSYQFNPQTLQPLNELGMVYPTLRLSDDWGVLEVDGDALVNQDAKRVSVSAAGIDPSKLKGAGWRLTLKQGWTVVPGARKGDVTVKKAGDSRR